MYLRLALWVWFLETFDEASIPKVSIINTTSTHKLRKEVIVRTIHLMQVKSRRCISIVGFIQAFGRVHHHHMTKFILQERKDKEEISLLIIATISDAIGLLPCGVPMEVMKCVICGVFLGDRRWVYTRVLRRLLLQCNNRQDIFVRVNILLSLILG